MVNIYILCIILSFILFFIYFYLTYGTIENYKNNDFINKIRKKKFELNKDIVDSILYSAIQ